MFVGNNNVFWYKDLATVGDSRIGQAVGGCTEVLTSIQIILTK